MQMLRRGDAVPHFTVTTVDGASFTYATVWQRSNLVLAVLPSRVDAAAVSAELRKRAAELARADTACVVTHEPVAGVPAPGVLVADRWGEVVHVAAAPPDGPGSAAADLLEWAEHVAHRCPECEGEAR